MEYIKINSVEELLTIPETVKFVEISQNEVIRFIYINKTNTNVQIDLQELRNLFARSVAKLYREKKYSENIVLDTRDIKNICFI